MSGLGVIAKEHKSYCELCGKLDELRPYGRNGELICFDCAMKDEVTTKKRFAEYVLGERNV